MSEKETVTLDQTTYVVEDLSKEGQAIVQSLKFVEKEIAESQARLAVLNTAKTAYVASFRAQASEIKH